MIVGEVPAKKTSGQHLFTAIDARLRALGQSKAWLVRKLGTEENEEGIRKRLDRARKGERELSALDSLLLGHALGLDPLYVATLYFSDAAARASDSPGPYRRSKILEELAVQLDGYSANQNRYTTIGRNERLALRYLRVKNRCLLNDQGFVAALGRAAGAKRGMEVERGQQQAKVLRGYELGKCSPNEISHEVKLVRGGDDATKDAEQVQLRCWLKAISDFARLRDPLTLDDLAKAANTMKQVHSAKSTLEPTVLEVKDARFFRIYLPPQEDGYDLKYELTRTVYGAIGIERVSAVQPKAARQRAARPIRILNACHDGLEIGVIVEGEVRLTLRDEPFAEEPSELTAPCDFKNDPHVLSDDIYSSTDNSVVLFPAGYWHRLEFRSAKATAISINLLRDVVLSRPGRGVISQRDALKRIARSKSARPKPV